MGTCKNMVYTSKPGVGVGVGVGAGPPPIAGGDVSFILNSALQVSIL